MVEKVRAKHDVANSAYAGCFTGGVMARTSGPDGNGGGVRDDGGVERGYG